MIHLAPMLAGLSWMDPEWLLERFGDQMFWLSVAIVFVECGLLFPILPGDTLLFSIGLFINVHDNTPTDGLGMNLALACGILTAAAFAGNVSGYEIGRRVGPRLFHREGRFLNTRNLRETQGFFDRHGNGALVLGRFVPVVRTFVTVVAGAADMERKRFFIWSLVGAFLWATGLTVLGYFLGEAVPALRNNLEFVLLGLVAFSLLPMLLAWWRRRRTGAAAG